MAIARLSASAYSQPAAESERRLTKTGFSQPNEPGASKAITGNVGRMTVNRICTSFHKSITTHKGCNSSFRTSSNLDHIKPGATSPLRVCIRCPNVCPSWVREIIASGAYDPRTGSTLKGRCVLYASLPYLDV